MFLEMYKIPLLCESNHKWKIDGLILNFEVNRLTLYDQDILFKNPFFFFSKIFVLLNYYRKICLIYNQLTLWGMENLKI